MEIFNCKCGSILHSPCTLPCGHTICRMCFEEFKLCTVCGNNRQQNYILNVTLACVLEHYLPDQYEAADLMWKAKQQINLDDYLKALELLTSSLRLVRNSTATLRMRAEVNLKLSRNKHAYRDAQKCCEQDPQCGESLFVLGAACAALNKLDDSVEAYQKCLECDPDDASLYGKVCEKLDMLLSMDLGPEIDVSDEEPENMEPVETATSQPESPTLHKKWQISADATVNIDNVNKPNRDDGDIAPKPNHDDGDIAPKLLLPRAELDNDNNLLESDTCLRNATLCPTSQIVPMPSQEPLSHKRSHTVAQSLQTKPFKGKKSKKVSEQLPTLDDFECKLCFFLLYQPITTPCGHVFCKICLERCADHSPSCPICRGQLEYNENSIGEITLVIQEATKHFFPIELALRNEKQEEYMEKMSR